MSEPRAGDGPLPLGILASGSGTNFDAIAAAIACGELNARIAIVVCNRPTAAVVVKARGLGLAVRLIDHRAFPDRATFDGAVADALEAAGAELVVLAGFNRIVTAALLRRFPMRVINIHPALLPAFRGAHAQQQAADYGVTITGATVHFVDDDVDHGPIILQAAVPVASGEG
ncbi:MAG: phosphoribosylglycinamide formyltransferase, partial [Deltaproteobacteria bacterium]|nr:phosphoribosylglycinamide formyltransferase [Deltaproteobacteria bacterium]